MSYNDSAHFLSELENDEQGYIVKVYGRGAFRKRIIEMGFVKGKKVRVVKKAPFNDPIEYEIMGYRISLRRSEAELIEIVKNDDSVIANQYNGTIDEEKIQAVALEKGKTINIALVGNPNSGKTTLFNHISGQHEHVGNYSGVTVDAKMASKNWKDYKFNVTDLPGTYSITEYSPEERFVRDHILENKPDIVINVIDASNLDRNLFLTTQLIDMDIKVIIALNMYDELLEKNIKFDYQHLGEMIGIPIIPTTANKGIGIEDLLDKSIEVYEDADPVVRHIHINYGVMIERAIRNIQKELWKDKQLTDRISSRYIAIKLIEQDKTFSNLIQSYDNAQQIEEVAKNETERLQKEYRETSETIITDAKYGFIDGALKETRTLPKEESTKSRKFDPDKILTHQWLSYPIFILILFLIFHATFVLGQYPMDWIDQFVSWLNDFVAENMAEGPLKDLLTQGIISGVGGVIIFLPNILILFFCISLLEDTGYMARATFIMDCLMHKIGLHGKSFIPMVMGFGCNVPAIMATRTLDNRGDRILTMLIIPFMSCSARLPIFILLVGTFFSQSQGLILLSLYLTGILVAICSALLLNKLVFSQKEVPFVMELPPYRIPTLKSTLIHMWEKGKQYLKKMGTVILAGSVIIWALGYFPRNPQLPEEQRIENSFIGKIGHAVEPLVSPLGFDWKMGVSLLTGAAAKEIVVSTMGVLYQAGDDVDENSTSLHEKLREQTFSSGNRMGQKVFTPVSAYTFMLFVLLYFPCIATIVAIGKEAGWKWAVFEVFYTTAVAWIISFAFFHFAALL